MTTGLVVGHWIVSYHEHDSTPADCFAVPEDLFTEFDIIIEQDESSPDCGPPPVPTQVCYDEANSPTIDFCALANDHGYMCPPALDT